MAENSKIVSYTSSMEDLKSAVDNAVSGGQSWVSCEVHELRSVQGELNKLSLKQFKALEIWPQVKQRTSGILVRPFTE